MHPPPPGRGGARSARDPGGVRVKSHGQTAPVGSSYPERANGAKRILKLSRADNGNAYLIPIFF